MVLVALELAGVLVSEVAAYYGFDCFVVTETFHVQVGAGVVAGAVIWAVSRAVDVSTGRTLAVVLGVGAVFHFALFALASEQFREGLVRTLQDLAGALWKRAVRLRKFGPTGPPAIRDGHPPASRTECRNWVSRCLRIVRRRHR